MAPSTKQDGLVEAAGRAEQGGGAQAAGHWPGHHRRGAGRIVLAVGAGDEVMWTGRADITKNLYGSAD